MARTSVKVLYNEGTTDIAHIIQPGGSNIAFDDSQYDEQDFGNFAEAIAYFDANTIDYSGYDLIFQKLPT